MPLSTTEKSRCARRETQDRSVPLRGREKQDRIDLGLALLARVAEPGVPYTQDEIAAWCGCTNGAIYQIEKRAIRKLQNRLKFESDPRVRELVADALERSVRKPRY